MTAVINALYEQAQKEPNSPTTVLMRWFISEQEEEEESAKLIVDQLRLAGDSGSAILVLHRELGARKGDGVAVGDGDLQFSLDR